MSGTRFLLKKFLSNIGISIVGAVGHNLCQLIIVYFLFINDKTIFLLVPILIFAGVIFGFITGYLVNRVLIFLPPKNVLEKTIFFNNEKFLLDEKFLDDKNLSNGKKNFSEVYYIILIIVMITIVLMFSIIKNIVVFFIICIFLLLKKFFDTKKSGGRDNLLKNFSKSKIFIYIFLSIIFINLFSTILYGYKLEQIDVLLKNIFISLFKLLTFILLTQELFRLRYINSILKKFPLIFKSIEVVNTILPKLDIKGKFNIVNFLEKLLIKDVFLNY
jgi:hypothetical protein